MSQHDGQSAAKRRATPRSLLWLVLAVAGIGAWFNWPSSDGAANAPAVELSVQLGKMRRLPGGSFTMGSSQADVADQKPAHRVGLPPFWLDVSPVTNRQFARFVAATQHVTTAERRGWSLVFSPKAQQWQKTPGATWQRPSGPDSSIAGRDLYPVVQVSWYDAVAYAHWAGKRLPTEAEYEFAARSGLADCDYPWGRKLKPDGHCLANFWQGWFPQVDAAEDQFAGASPVDAFPPNCYGLFDIAGNVWCWCSDWYGADYYARSERISPRGPLDGEQRVRRGGSWTSATHYGDGLRVSHRDFAAPEVAANHTGFRCAQSE